MFTAQAIARAGLEPADLKVAPGECLALLGPSGAGKTLLLRALADLDPGEGEAWLDGVERRHVSACEWRRRVGYLATESGWWEETAAPHFRDRARAEALAARLGLADGVLDRPLRQLSTGERQRLALIRLLENEPRVLLLDEPTSALDAAAEEKVEALLKERLGAGAVIVLVTHDPAQARRLARRAARMEAGRLAELPGWT